MIIIYALTDNDVIFYIGQTENLYNRFKCHKSQSKNKCGIRQKRINDILENNRSLNCIELNKCTQDNADKLEMWYINYYLSKGVKLINVFNKPNKKRNTIIKCDKLTALQLNVLKLIGEDYTTKEIADKVFLSMRSIEKIRRQIKVFFKVKTLAGLVASAYKAGYYK